MNSNESIEVLNKRLTDHYSTAWNGYAMYRIVWSEDQIEKRWTAFTDSGLALINPEVRELPKYKQWIHEKYILEHLVVVPDGSDLVEKISYEPLWVFQDKRGFPLPPKWEAAKLVIDTMLAASGVKSLARYKENLEQFEPEVKEAELKRLQDELFGNETNTTDALAYHEGVVVPSNYQKVN